MQEVARPPKGFSDLMNGPTSREFIVCPLFYPFFGGITTEEGVKKRYYDLLKRYIGLFLSPSSVVYPLKKDSKRAISLFQRSRTSARFPEILGGCNKFDMISPADNQQDATPSLSPRLIAL